jgi:hypothetical protein
VRDQGRADRDPVTGTRDREAGRCRAPATPALETIAGVAANGSEKVMSPASPAVPYSIWVLSMITAMLTTPL